MFRGTIGCGRNTAVSRVRRQGLQKQVRPQLTMKVGPVREVRGVEVLRLRIHHLINLEKERVSPACPVLAQVGPRVDGWSDRQRDSHQRKAQSCPGPVDCGQLLSQCRGHGASQVGRGEDGATAAGALVASRSRVLG